MTDRHIIIAFCSTLAAILYLVTVAAVLAFYERYTEALGLGGAATGLIGVLGSFLPRTQGDGVRKS